MISIHPRHAEAILEGRKLVELRRAPFADDTELAIIYATAPVSAIVGWFRVGGIERGSITAIWEQFGRVSAISRREHRAYFAGARSASAIRIADAQRLSAPSPLAWIAGVRRPPQSYQYISPTSIEWMLRDRLERTDGRDTPRAEVCENLDQLSLSL